MVGTASGASGRRSAVVSGVLTGASTLTVAAAAAATAALLAQKFGRTAETDGFLAAYGAYVVLAFAAQASRVVVVPDLTRAALEGRLAAETGAYAAVLLAVGLVGTALAVPLANPLADALVGDLPAAAAETAARAIPWLVPTAVAQALAALAASTLAAADDYAVAAGAYAAGAIAGLVLFLVLADEHGVQALAWGIALNGAIAVALPAAVLVARRLVALPRRLPAGRILAGLGIGVALPLALQGLYVISLRFAADEGVGEVTGLSYAYLIASVFVAATASSLSLISSAPLTRRGLDADGAAHHVINASWLSLAVVLPAAGVFALAGEQVVSAVLGDAFSGEAGRDLGRLVVALVPFAVAATAFSLTFPLVFVAERSSVLIPLALLMPPLHALLCWGLREAFGVVGIAVSLALSTLLVLLALLGALSIRTLELAAVGLARLTLVAGAFAAAAFGLAGLVLDGLPAAAVGLAVYGVLLAVARPRGLAAAWAYIRGLH